jgi:ParB/RepB/Spo0J family partition protein
MTRQTEKVTIRGFNQELPMNQIKLAETNVRKTRPRSRLEELKTSISRFGLLHPVIVIQTGKNKYKLVVGQRRYLAFQELGMDKIPALIVNPLDPLSESVVSFAENIHRRDLPYEDTIRICGELFKVYGGSKIDRIRRISAEIGIPLETVSRYIAFGLIPVELRQLVDQGRVTRDQAYRLTRAFWPNKDKIIKLAHRITRLTKEERRKLLDYGTKNPDAPVDNLLEEALKPEETFELVIPIDMETYGILEKLAKKRGTDVPTLVRERIEEALPDMKEELTG